MKYRKLYIALGLLLLFLTAVKVSSTGTGDVVTKGKEEMAEAPQWTRLIVESINAEEIRLQVDGKEILLDEKRAYMNPEQHLMIPYQILTEAFACSASLFYEEKLVIEKNKVELILYAGSDVMEKNGAEILLPAPAVVEDGTFYLPVEAVAEGLGYTYEWKNQDYTAVLTDNASVLSEIPHIYDYREKGRAPQVKNQGSLGTCWAFASLMALESRLLPEYDLDFSEDHMSLQNSFHLDQNAGGEYTMSMAYLLAWQGPVLESQDPYGDGISPQGLSPVCHVQEIRVLPGKDYEAIKRAVYLYGGVQSSLYTSMVTGQSDQRYYNKETGAYCYIGTARPNHDVVIIGWDDTYPKENFNLTPEGDGAFICANSWGGEFGDDGYFYVSYYDSNIGSHNILYSRVEAADNYDQIYQTDLCGWVGQLGYGKENAWFANIYTARGREKLEAVGFYATGANTSYEVYTVSDAEGSSRFGRRRLAASGTLADAGYYTIDLKRPLRLEEGERFAVIVSVRTPGAVHPVAIEYNSPDKGLTADLSDGEGYISFRGTVWERVEKEQDCNVCLKAYTKSLEESE